VLNLGHTTGHALEQVSGFQMRHGEAISVGMVAAAQIATALGLAEPTLPGRIAAVLAAHGLPVTCPPLQAQSLWAAMGHDKKRHGTALHWVLPRDIGQVEIRADVPAEVVLRVLRDMGAT
jgi:3-dehydroquinate synthetase